MYQTWFFFRYMDCVCIAYILQNICIFTQVFMPVVLWRLYQMFFGTFSSNLLMGMEVEETYSYFV